MRRNHEDRLSNTLTAQVIHVGTNDGCHPSDRELRRPIALADFRALLHRTIDTVERHREGALVIFTTTLPLRGLIEHKRYESEDSLQVLRTRERQAQFAQTIRDVVEEAQRPRTKCRVVLADTERGMLARADTDERGLGALFRDCRWLFLSPFALRSARDVDDASLTIFPDVHLTDAGKEMFAQILAHAIGFAEVGMGM